MEEIIIRPAQPEDAKVVQTIIYKWQTWSPAYQKIFGEQLEQCKDQLDAEKIERTKKYIAEKDNQKFYKVAEVKQNKKIIWICHWYTYPKQEVADILDHPEYYWELKELYIDPTVQSKGIGRLLLQDFEQWLLSKGKNKCIIRTLSDNPQSNWFYQKNWYQDTGKRSSKTIRGITAKITIYSKNL